MVATGVFTIKGSLELNTKTFSSNGTIDTAVNDIIIYADTSSAPITLTLPVPTAGRTIFIKDKSQTFGTNSLTINRNGSEKIDGTASSMIVSTNNQEIIFHSDGSDWHTTSSIGVGSGSPIPFQTIIGDNPNTIPFLSRRDIAPLLNSWIASHVNVGGKIKLINPCFKSHVNFEQVVRGITVELEGICSILVNGGEIELQEGCSLVGATGGADLGVAGNFDISAAIKGYNYAGGIAVDDRLSGLDGYLTGPYYMCTFQGFPSNTISDSLTGHVLHIISGGDGTADGYWAIIGQPQAPNYKGITCIAVFTGAGKPTQNQSGLTWAIDGVTGPGTINLFANSLTPVMKLSGLSSNTLTNFNMINAWKSYAYISNTTQTWLNGNFRIVGAENSIIAGWNNGTMVCYIVNNVALENTYVSASTLPEYGTGGTSGSPTVHYQFSSAIIRAQGNVVTMKNLLLPECPGVGIMIDSSRFLTAGVELNKVGVTCLTSANVIPLVIDSAFEVYIRDSQFNGFTGTSNSCSVLITGSQASIGSAGLIYFDTCSLAGTPILMQNQSTGGAQGNLRIENLLTESLSTSPIMLDPRGGQAAEVIIGYQSQNDAIIPGATIDELVPGRTGDYTIVRIWGGSGTGTNVGPNVVNPLHLDIKQQEYFTSGLGISLGSQANYLLERGNRVDAALTNAPTSFSPTIQQGFDITILNIGTWDSSTGTTPLPTITYPSTLRGPDGITNGSNKIMPLFHSTDGGFDYIYVTPGTGGQVGITPQNGDYIIMGCWVKAQDATQPINSGTTNFAFVSGVKINGSFSGLNLFEDTGFFIGSAWTFISSIGKVTSGGGSPNAYLVTVGVAGNTDLVYRNFWCKYIPTSAGIPEREIIRWYRHGSRNYIPGTATGNLGIDGYQSLDWAGKVTLGSPSSGVLQTNGSFSTVGITNTGGIVNHITSVAASTYSMLAADSILAVNFAGASTVTLLPSPVVGKTITIKDASGAAGTNHITVTTSDSSTIDGLSSYVIIGNYDSVTIAYTASGKWSII